MDIKSCNSILRLLLNFANQVNVIPDLIRDPVYKTIHKDCTSWIKTFTGITKKLCILIAATIFFSPATFAQNNLKIVVIDVQYVLDNSNAVNNLRKSIDEISEKLHKEMSDKEITLKNTEADLIKKQSILKPEEFNLEVNKFHKKVSEAQHEMQNKKTKLEKAHAEAIGMVHDSTIKIIAELAKEHNFDIALPTAQILYANDNLSITKEVVERLNKKIKSIPLNYQ